MYICLILLLLFFIKKYEFTGPIRFNAKAYNFLLVIFILMSGLRYRLGFDSVMYEDAFSQYPDIFNYKFGYEYAQDAIDLFWALLNSICRTFSDSFVLVQLVMGTFTNSVVFWFLKRHSSRPFLAVLLYMITLWPLLTFEALREGLSVTFFIYALDALVEKKDFKSYYLRVWPAVFFHTFGFITLLFPLISFIKPSKATWVLTTISAITVVVGGYALYDYISPFMVADSIASDKMQYYLESDVYGSNTWSLGGVLFILLGSALPIFLLSYTISKYGEKKCQWLFPYLVFMIIVSLFKINLPVFYRFFNYFYIVLILGMTETMGPYIETNKNRINNTAKLCTFLIVFMVLYGFSKPVGSTKYPSLYRYYPYNSIITKDYNQKTEALLPK